jgi:hypothetical protein
VIGKGGVTKDVRHCSSLTRIKLRDAPYHRDGGRMFVGHPWPECLVRCRLEPLCVIRSDSFIASIAPRRFRWTSGVVRIAKYWANAGYLPQGVAGDEGYAHAR